MADDTATSFSRTPDDPTPYIRTYAKDVARLTGTKAAQTAGPKKDAPTPGVKFGEVDMSQTQGTRNDSASPREFPQEQLSVTKEDTFENLNPPMPTREDKRDEILSRLRAKVQPPAPTPVPPPAPPAPVIPAPKPVPPPPPAPVPQPLPVPAAPMPFAPAPRPTPPPAPVKMHRPLFSRHEPEHAKDEPKSDLHTFKSDFADRIDSQKASTFSVLAAQSDSPDTRAQAPQPVKLPSKNKSRMPMILAASLLVVLGIGGLGAAYWFVVLRSPMATPFTVPSLIFADEKVELPSDTGPLTALAHVAQEPSVSGNVIVTYVTTTTNGKQGVIKTPQPGGPLIKQMFTSAPDILLRNIDDTSTVGVINAGNANAPFFVLHVTSYERTFAGMLGWEPTIGADLAQLYAAHAVAAGTSTSPVIVTAPHFIDSTVANHDVRVLKDGTNQTVLLYGYRDKETLIIAKDEAAFTALLVRLNAAHGS